MVTLANRAHVYTSTTGTGTITLGSAVAGFQTLADAGITDGQTVRYVIEDDTNWEIGSGTYTAAGTTLTRTVSESSSAGAAISLSGNARVFLSPTAEDLQFAADMDQGVATTDSPTFANISVSGTVDGRDVSVDGTKLDGIESGATADQTPSEIKTAYESNADTNAFTDAEKTKLAGIEAGADVTDTANVTAAGALMDSEVTNLAAVKAFDPTDYATAAQGALADTAVQPGDSPSFGSVTVTGTVDGRDVSVDGAKLDGIEAGADVTDTANVTAAGALMDSEVTNLAAVKAFDPNDYVGQTALTGSAELPVGTTAQRDVTPAAGYIRFNSTDGTFEGYDGVAWGSIGGAGGGLFKGENGEVGSSAGDIFRVNEQTLNTNVTIDADENASATGPLTIASGVTLTVTSGGNLSIV